MEDYQSLALLYGLIRTAYADPTYVDKELTAKTRELLQEHTDSDPFELPGSIQELNANTLSEIGDSDVSDTVKVLNLRKVLRQVVIDESGSKPFLIPIGARAGELAEAYENRQLTTQQALAAYEQFAAECEQETSDHARLNLNENAYAVYKILAGYTEDITPEQARDVDSLFGQFPDYQWNEQQDRDLTIALYKTLRPLVGESYIDATNALLDLQRI